VENTYAISNDTIVQWHPAQITTEIQGEVVAMSVVRGLYIGMDDMASNIWRRLSRRHSVAALCDELGREFQGDPATISQDVIELLSGLHGLGIIVAEGAEPIWGFNGNSGVSKA